MAKYGNEAVRGLSALRRQFKALPEITRDALADATEETAEQIRAGAVRRVPVRFGFLRDHIAAKMNRQSGVAVVGIARGSTVIGGVRVRGIVVAGRGGSSLKSEGAGFFQPTKYGHFAEFGTIHEHPRPFMLPSAEEQRGPYLQRAKDAGKAIERDMAAIGARVA